MSTAAIREPRSSPIRSGLPNDFKPDGTVYAIAFDMDIEQLRVHYGAPYNNAYLEVRRVLDEHHFKWQQGSVYFGSPEVTAAKVMVAVIDLTTKLPWFAAAVRDIRMLRIEELSSLVPVVERVIGLRSEPASSDAIMKDARESGIDIPFEYDFSHGERGRYVLATKGSPR